MELVVYESYLTQFSNLLISKLILKLNFSVLTVNMIFNECHKTKLKIGLFEYEINLTSLWNAKVIMNLPPR